MKHFFIIAGGKIEDAFAIEVLKGFAEKTVIAADSGMEFLRRNEIVPQVIIGDFDSVSKETLEWFQKKEGIVWHRLNPQRMTQIQNLRCVLQFPWERSASLCLVVPVQG